jgi:hypothetical protein
VSAVHSVLSIDISNTNEGVVADLHEGDLMHRGMRPQTDLSTLVICVRGPSADVVLWDS